MSLSKEEFSDTDSDDGFNEDMEALKRACQLTGKNPTDHQLQLPSTTGAAASATASSEAESDGEGEEDLQLVRSIQERFAVPMDMDDEPLMMRPLCTLPPDWSDSDDCDDDYETLRVIQRRFAAYNDGGLEDNVVDFLHRPVQVGSSIIDSEKETYNSFVERTNAREGFLNCVDTSEPTGEKAEACDDAGGTQPFDLVECNGPGIDDVAGLPLKSSHFPKSALAFVDAIKKNRSCQKLIRSKMMQMEARMEELNKLMEHVKILKDFQVACKKRTGRALSQKKDARVQLISVPKLRANIKLNEKKIPAVYKGPSENAHVAYFKEALATFGVNVSREKWSKEEKENLVKGVKQQFQEMLLQRSVDLLSDADGSYDPGNVDSILVSIKDIDIKPDQMRLFLPKVNWDQLAAMYVPGRSGAECQARFLNFDDPLINDNPWTAMEDKNILHIVQQKGLSNWVDIAASLGTNRTPFQCLVRYQRSLNASILKREWTKEEDNQLRTAVETYGESNWQVVASVMEGRTGTQCSNRWLKTLHPARKRVGKWTAEEDKRLKVAATLFGPKTWKKIARFVSGRTHVQCRERWVNCLDPSLNTSEWTEEEDSKLEMAIEEHGYCWSKVAACIPRRTDNQCWRRWKALFPNEVPMHQAAREMRKFALISNFVDRESERPALGLNDFVLPETYRVTGSENADPSRRKRRRSRRREAHEHDDRDGVSGEICSEEVPRLSDGNEVENLQGGSIPRKRRAKRSRSINNNAGPSSSQSSPCPDTVLLDMSNGAEIRKSRVNDGNVKRRPHGNVKRRPHGNVKRRPRLQKKRSSVKSKSVDGAPTPGAICKEMIVIESHANIYENQKRHEEAGEVTILKTKKEMKTENIRTDATNDYLSSFPDSMSLMEAVRGIKAMKRKRKAQETFSSSDCVSLPVDDQSVRLIPAHTRTNTAIHGDGIVDLPVSGNLEDCTLFSDRDYELQHKENAIIALTETENENTPLTSSLVQSGADRTHFSSAEVGKSPRKAKYISQVQTGSSSVDVSLPDQTKRRKRSRDGACSSRMVEIEVRNNSEACTNQTVVVEAGDDTTLSEFYNKLKKRRTVAPEVQQSH